MKICFCLSGPNELNGPNVWLTRHLPLLKLNGYSPEVLYLNHCPEMSCQYFRYFQGKNIPCRNVNMKGFVEERACSILTSFLDDVPDFFVPNYSIPAYFAARFLREAGTITLGTLHSDDPYYHDIIDLFIDGMEDWRLSGSIGVSEHLTALVNHRGYSSIPYLHAPYGAPVPTKKCTWTDEKPLRLVYAGRLVERQKRVLRLTQRLIQAAEHFSNVEAVLYGSGPEEIAVQQIIDNSSVYEKLWLGGSLDSLAMQDAMLKGHLFILLSDFEGLSISLMEAMACGLVPVVSNMKSGVTDLIVSGVNGFIIDPDNSQEFLQVIETISNDRLLWQRLSTAARQTILEKEYTSDNCANLWAGFLESFDPPTKKRKLIFPPVEEWKMPSESERPDGIRCVDKRSPVMKALSLRLGDRPLFLWGASRAGEDFLNALEGHAGFKEKVIGFIDSNPIKHGGSFSDLPVFSPEILLSFQRGIKPYVIITSSYGSEISKTLECQGYQYSTDYI